MMEVVPIPILDTNYSWILIEEDALVVIDPGSSQEILEFIEGHTSAKPISIWLTHEHDDHVAGVAAIQEKFPDIQVFGPQEVSELVDNVVSPHETFEFLSHQVLVIPTPGHTEDHISYLIESNLFCGDALFSAGCGRVFTEDYQAQFETLQRLAKLPDDTKVFAGHEYTLDNLAFAKMHLSENDFLMNYTQKMTQRRHQNLPTLPSTISIEKVINPFLRAKSVKEFKLLRDKRDDFTT